MRDQLALFESAGSKAPKTAPRTSIGLFDAGDLVHNFDVLAQAKEGILRFRGLLLDLAVRGKFTSPQLSSRTEGDGPFPIPVTWRWSKGSDLFTVVTSGSRGWAQFYADDGPLFLRIGNLDYHSIALDLREVQRVQPPPNAEGIRTKVQAGDVLVSITGDTGMVGLVPDGLGEAYINQHIALARPGPSLFPRFVARALTAPSLLAQVQRAQRGIKNSLGLDDIRNLPLPVPPIDEQERIAVKIDQLMALCDELEARQAKTREVGDRLTKAALEALAAAEGPEEFEAAWGRVAENVEDLLDRPDKVTLLREAILCLAMSGTLVSMPAETDALTEIRIKRARKIRAHEKQPHAIPRHWVWVRLEDLVGSIADGDHQPPPKEASGIAFLTIGNMSAGRLDFTETRFVSRKYFDKLDPRRVPRKGDILYTVVGATYGRPVLVDEDREFCVQRHIAIIRPDDTFERQYLYTFLRSPVAYVQATACITGTAQPTVPLKPLRQFAVPVPPRAEQRAIVSRVEHLMKLCDDLEARLRARDEKAAKLAEALVAQVLG